MCFDFVFKFLTFHNFVCLLLSPTRAISFSMFNGKKKVFCVASNEYAVRIKIPENGTSIPCGFNGMWPKQLVDHYPPYEGTG